MIVSRPIGGDSMLSFQTTNGVERRHKTPLTIALINNMPDAGLRATERQFCRLLQTASEGIHVNLKFYTPLQLPRSPSAKDHIARYYERFDELEDSAPDGVIVTGAEPSTTDMSSDPCCRPIAYLVNWVEDNRIPAIWSCLAAHFALLHLDGIERQPLREKLSGLFECRLSTRPNQLLRGLAGEWRVPHSRFNGISENALVSNGYSVISHSRQAGPDIFMRHGGAIQLFFQGHPEYEASTLLNEYRRDIKRALAGSEVKFPAPPRGCFHSREMQSLPNILKQLRNDAEGQAWSDFERLLQNASPGNAWNAGAARLYGNWLSYLDHRRQESEGKPRPLAVLREGPGLAA